MKKVQRFYQQEYTSIKVAKALITLLVYLAILGINSTDLNVDSIVTINAKAEVVTLNGWQFYKNLQAQKFAKLLVC